MGKGSPTREELLAEIERLSAIEREAHRNEELARIVADLSPVAITVTDLAGNLLLVNRQAALMHGFDSVDQALEAELNAFELIAEEDRPKALDNARKVSSGLPIRDVEYDMLRRDGSRFPAMLSASALHGPDGRPEAWIGVVRDMSERRHSQEQLQQSEEKYRTLIESLPHGVSIVQGHTIVYSNRATAQILGFEQAADLIGRPAEELMASAERDRIVPLLAKLQKAAIEGPIHYTTEALRQDGEEFPVDVFATRIHYNQAPAIQLFIMDISDRVRSEQERLELQTQVQHVQKLESLGVLAGGIAHDFNNLLMGVLGNVGLAMLDAQVNSVMAEHLKNIETAALRAAELTRQMLAYSGKGRFVVGPIQINTLAEEITDLLKTVVSKKATLEFQFDRDLPLIHGDAGQLRQVIMNLFTNASEALGDRPGTIRLRTGCIEADRETLANTYLDEDLPPGRYAFFEIQDEGEGMEPEIAARMFDPYFTTKFTGRGLGLAAVLGIVRGHQGAIHVDSQAGQGSTVTVLLPAQIPSTTSPQPVQDLEDGSSELVHLSGTVLLADDEDGVRRTCRAMLERIGFEVLIAVDGKQALDMIRLHADRLTAGLLDLTMPRMDGREVLAQLREFLPELPVLLTSGYTEQEALEGLPASERTFFVQKPFSPNQLGRLLQKLLDG
jgi:PAS domain S-box-containing protein